MKIQCDVCEKEEASVFCCADEAALCGPCDHRVHHANKLAGKHHRFSLVHPSVEDTPLCDICQKRRAMLFCKEDRAILCKECDSSIHKANEHTQKHNRYLLSGIKLSPFEPSLNSYQTSTSSYGSNYYNNGAGESETEMNTSSIQAHHNAFESASASCKIEKQGEYCMGQEYGTDHSVSTSSISEYLMETLPGWHVEEFLDPSSSPYGFLKDNDYTLSYIDNDLNGLMGGAMPSQDIVPQGPPQYSHDHLYHHQTGAVLSDFGPPVLNNSNNRAENVNKSSKKWSSDNSAAPTKKSKRFW